MTLEFPCDRPTLGVPHRLWLYFRAFKSVRWAFADQMVVSGSNFVTSILLARFIGIQEFGRFVLAWTIVLFVQNLQSSAIGSTMLSIGPKQDAEAAPAFFGSMFILQVTIGLVCAALALCGTLIAAHMFPDLGLEPIAAPLTVAIICAQTHDFLRRYFFAISRLPVSFCLDAIRYVGQMVAILTLGTWVPANGGMALWLISISAAGAAILALPFVSGLKFSAQDVINVGLRSWHFSKWLAGSTLLGFAFANLFTFAVGILLDAAAVGAMRAAFALVSITNLIVEAFGNVVPVSSSRELMTNGRSGLISYLKKIAIYGTGAIGCLLAVIVVRPRFWLHLFFGSEFEPFSDLILWYAAIQLVTFFAFVLGTFYRTLESTRFIFAAYAFSAALSLLIAYPLISNFGLNGAMIGLLTGQIAQLLFMLVAGAIPASLR